MVETAQNGETQSFAGTAPAPTGMRTFVIIWIGQVISIVGSSLTHFGLGVWIFEQTGDAIPFTLTVLFASLPRVFLLPVAGSLADQVFEPLMAQGGALASTALGTWMGTGPGRGIGLIYVVSGVLVILISAVAYLNPRIRRLEEEVPDAVAG